MNTTSDNGRSTEPSGLFVDRLVAKYNATQYISAFIDKNSVPLASPAFSPRTSRDTALTAFAQLTAVRLEVSRALISLLSGEHQYILTEANRTLTVRPITRYGPEDGLWLGCVKIPRSNGVCGSALSPSEEEKASGFKQEPETGITTIEDLQSHPRYQVLPQIPGTSRMKSYAGIPIRHPSGAKIGVLCVFDEKVGLKLSEEQKAFLSDMSQTVMAHLDAVRIRIEHQRRHKLLMGLESFTNGLSDIKSISDEPAQTLSQSAPEPISTVLDGSMTGASKIKDADTPALSDGAQRTGRQAPEKPLWELALPPGTKTMFSRAANIMRQAGDYDGVAFFYVPSALAIEQGLGRHSHGLPQIHRTSLSARQEGLDANLIKISSPTSDNPTSSFQNSSSSFSSCSTNLTDANRDKNQQSRAPRPCPVLGYSINSGHGSAVESSREPFSEFSQEDLACLLDRNPRGRIYVLNQEGQVVQNDPSSPESDFGENQCNSVEVTKGHELISPDIADHGKSKRPAIRSLKKLSTKAQSFTSLPLWDFERQRWFAYAVCWSNSASRDPNTDGDLDFLRIFGSSIMNALAHIDTLAVDKAKNAFVSSISHELRTPLHGVMTATNLLQDSDLDRPQREMVDYISKSGRILLDTLDHVMEFAKVKTLTNRTLQESSAEGARLHDNIDRIGSDDLSQAVDLIEVLEEVLDSVLVGFTAQREHVFAKDSLDVPQTPYSPSRSSPKAAQSTMTVADNRGHVRVILQIQRLDTWRVVTQVGAWKRIIMNLFGNALKYTDNGTIAVRIESVMGGKNDDLTIHFSVVDTGKGISQEFLENRIFRPFSQEDSFSAGTGLGLSIVNQIVSAMNGTVQITSAKGAGTRAAIKIPVKRAGPDPSASVAFSFTDTFPQDKGLEVCIFDDADDSEHQASRGSGETAFVDNLSVMLTEWCGISHVYKSPEPPDTADLVLFSRASFKTIHNILQRSGEFKTRCFVVIAYDALEMAALQADARLRRGDLAVEIVCQPLGPHKLRATLQQCIIRRKESVQNSLTSIGPSDITNSTLDDEPISPIAQAKVAETDKAVNEVKLDEPRESASVLIVDDNKINIRLLSVFLDRLKVTYDTAMNGQEAVNLFIEAKGSYKCVLMDISMPVMDGMTATRLIREHETKIRSGRALIAALTGLTSAAAQSDALDAGVDLYLTKPISLKVLREALPEGLLKTKSKNLTIGVAT